MVLLLRSPTRLVNTFRGITWLHAGSTLTTISTGKLLYYWKNTHHHRFSKLSSPYILQRRDCQAVNPNNNQEKLIWSHQRRPKQRDVGKVRQHCHPSNESHVKVPSTSLRPRRWENGNYEAPNEPGLPLAPYPREFEEGTGITKDSMNQTMDNLQHNHLNFFVKKCIRVSKLISQEIAFLIT